MQSLSAKSCCPQASHGHGQDPTVEQEECCSARRLAVLAPAPLPAVPEVLVAPPAVVTSEAPRVVVVREPRRERFAHPVRAGPASAAERRAELMVFHC